MIRRDVPRWTVVISALLLLLIAARTIRHWPTRGFWYDETVNAYFTEHSFGDIWEWCTRIDNQMPLDFALRKVWGTVAGTSEFALRVYSVLLTLLSTAGVIALGWRLGKTLFAGWVAAGAFALTQSFLYAAFEVRPYALALALFAWASVILWALWGRYADGTRPFTRRYGLLLVAYWLLALALVYTHYTGILALAAHGVFVGVDTLLHRTRRRWSLLLQLGAGLALGYVPWLWALAGRDIRAGTAYHAHIKPLQALETYVSFYAYGQRHVLDSTPPYAWVAAFLVLAATMIAVALNGQRPDRERGVWYAFSLALIPLVGLLLMVYMVQGKLSGRHGWPVWVGAALLVGVGVASFDRLRQLRWLAAVVGLALVWLPGRADLQPTYNSYLREAFSYVNAHAQPGDVLVLHDGTLFTAADYYDVQIPWIGLPPEKITNVNRYLFADEALRQTSAFVNAHDARRVWVLSWQGHIMDPQDIVSGIMELIGEPLPLEGTYGFGDVSLLLYQLHGNPDTLRSRIELLHPVIETPHGGPLYHGGYILDSAAVPRGGVVSVHTWWQRGTMVLPGMRVSVRLYDGTGRLVAQHDQPPVSPYFGQENWRRNERMLSRFTLWVPPDMSPGSAEVRLVIYDMDGLFEPVMVPIGRFEVQE